MYSEILLVTCFTCILKFLALMLGALLFGLLAGWWLWGKYKSKVDGLNFEIKDLRKNSNEREKNFASLKYAHDELDKDNSGMRSTLAGCEGDRAALQAALNRSKEQLAMMAAAVTEEDSRFVKDEGIDVKSTTEKAAEMFAGIIAGAAGTGGNTTNQLGFASYGNYFNNTNLQIIEGVGPKISRALQAGGVKNWGDLANKSAKDLEVILTEGGISARINNPKTWPAQANLANKGKWEELVNYQKTLDTNVASEDFETPAKVEKLYLKAIGFSGAKPENLKVVEGIGPKIEALLKGGGINNWSELATIEIAKIQDILNVAGPRYKLANPSTWPRQAALAVEGKWDELKSYQDSLNGGR